MDVRVKGESIDRELRRRQLARRLLFHGARTRTIVRLTGLSKHQQETLRLRLHVTNKMRRRGQSPTSFEKFRSRAREEAAALAVFWCVLGAAHVPSMPAAARSALEFGERICEVFEAYRACLPASTFEIEHLLLLVTGLERGDDIALSQCRECTAVMLVDPLEERHRSCARCQGVEVSASLRGDANSGEGCTRLSMHNDRPVQLTLF